MSWWDLTLTRDDFLKWDYWKCFGSTINLLDYVVPAKHLYSQYRVKFYDQGPRNLCSSINVILVWKWLMVSNSTLNTEEIMKSEVISCLHLINKCYAGYLCFYTHIVMFFLFILYCDCGVFWCLIVGIFITELSFLIWFIYLVLHEMRHTWEM